MTPFRIAIVLCLALPWFAMADGQPRGATHGAKTPTPTPDPDKNIIPIQKESVQDDGEHGPSYIRRLISHQSWKILMRRASDSLDQLQKRLEEYGTATVSSVMLAPPGGNFKFNLAIDASTFYADAKKQVEGSAAAREIINQSFSGGLNANAVIPIPVPVAPAAAAAPAATTAAAPATSGSAAATPAAKPAPSASSSTTTTTTSSAALVAAPDGIAQSIADLNTASNLNLTNFTPLLTNNLSANQVFSIPDRAAIITAAGDAATQSLLGFLGDPGSTSKFKDKVIFVAVASVAVDPGWRTKKDFAAEITLHTTFRYAPARTSILQKIVAAGTALDTAVAKAVSDDANVTADTKNVTQKQTDLRPLLAALQAADKDARDAKIDSDDKDRQLNLARAHLENLQRPPPPGSNAQPPDAKDLDDAKKAVADALASAGPAQSAFDAKAAAAETVREKWESAALALKEAQAQLDTDTATAKAKATKQAVSSSSTSLIFPPAMVDLAQQRLSDIDSHTSRPKKAIDLNTIPKAFLAPADGTAAGLLVAAVSPMTDSQTLDLQDQFRRQDALALNLAAALSKANLGAQAQAFEQFTKLRQKEAQTVSNSGVVNTFSYSGGFFGFEVGPRLKALADPASRRGGSGNILDRQSFPAMFLYGVDQNDILPKVRCNDGHWDIVEPGFTIIQTTRWKPLTHKLFSWGDFYDPHNWHAPRLDENTRLDTWVELVDAMNGLNELQGSFLTVDPTYDKLYNLLCERFETVKSLFNGSYESQSLPIELILPDPGSATSTSTPKVASVDSFVPSAITLAADANNVINASALTTTVYVTGSNLDQVIAPTATVLNNDSIPSDYKISVAAAFSDPDPKKINASCRKLTLTITPGATTTTPPATPPPTTSTLAAAVPVVGTVASTTTITTTSGGTIKVPPALLVGFSFPPDTTKLTAGATAPPPVVAPGFAVLRANPPEGLKGVVKNSVRDGDGKVTDQTIYVDPSVPDRAQDNANSLILQGEQKAVIPIPTQVSKLKVQSK